MCIYPMKLRGHRLAVLFTGPWTLQIIVSDEVQTLIPKPHDGVITQSPKPRKPDTRRRRSLRNINRSTAASRSIRT